MDEYKSVQRYLNKNNNKTKVKKTFPILNKILLSGLLLVLSLCLCKTSNNIKNFINKNVYQTNISFAKFNKIYEKYFGSIFPIDDTKLGKVEPVFNEKLTYASKEDYKEGVKLIVGDNYLVPILESGIVVFMGNKDNYGNTIIIQQVDGIDLWYVGIENTDVKMYDYVEKGNLLGESISNEIYLYYQKEGEFLDYKEYL